MAPGFFATRILGRLCSKGNGAKDMRIFQIVYGLYGQSFLVDMFHYSLRDTTYRVAREAGIRPKLEPGGSLVDGRGTSLGGSLTIVNTPIEVE